MAICTVATSTVPFGYWAHAVGRGAARGFLAALLFAFGLVGLLALASGSLGDVLAALFVSAVHLVPLCLLLGGVPGALFGAAFGAAALRWRGTPAAFVRWCAAVTFVVTLPLFAYGVYPWFTTGLDNPTAVAAALAPAALATVAAARHAVAVLRVLRGD
jgi:hypothetical protein